MRIIYDCAVDNNHNTKRKILIYILNKMNFQKTLDDYIKTLCDNDKQCRPIDKFNYDDLYKFASSIGIRYDDLIEGSFNNQSSIC